MSAPRMSVLDPAGPQAGAIAGLWDWFFWICVAVWVLVVIALVLAVVKARRAAPVDPLLPDPARERRILRVVVGAGIATALTLVALLMSSVSAGERLASLEHDPLAVHVRITAHQWWWEIEYEREDLTLYAATANELHVPVGRTVHIELASADVIHSFWIPSVHGKRDLIPGRISRTWIRVDEPGVFRGQCAEFCGLQHAKMALTIVAEPYPQWLTWLGDQRAPAQVPASLSESAGRDVFLGGPCVLCHSVAGTEAGGRLGPDLTHVRSRGTLAAGALPMSRESLRQWISDPQRVKPGSRMPPTALTPTDLEALLDYLERLR